MVRLPSGPLVARLSGGGDLAEAYLLTAAGILRIQAGRPFRTDTIAATQALQGALVPAPDLTQFVGEQTVLIVRSADGSLVAYQAGRQLWQNRLLGASELVQAGDLAFARAAEADSWRQLRPETGMTAALVGKPPCSPGPVAGLKTGSLIYCAAAGLLIWVPAQAGNALPSLEGRPWALRPVHKDEVVLLWPGGTWYHVDGSGRADRHGRVPAFSGRPALAPDGSVLYVATAHGIEALPLAGGRGSGFGSGGATAVATSRDGNFIYALYASELRVYDPSGRLVKSHPQGGTDIDLVVGG